MFNAVTELRRPVRAVLVSVVATSAFALLVFLAAVAPTISAAAATAGTLTALAIGLAWNGRRHHSGRWQALWVLLASSLLLATFTTIATTIQSGHGGLPATPEWLRILSGVLAVVAISGFLDMRARGVGTDAALEGALLASVLLFVPWAWGVVHHVGELRALTALLPLAVWIVALWVLCRLLFLSSEQVQSYRYLAVAFVCVVLINAVDAVAALNELRFDHARILGVLLFGFVLWGASALHPSLRLTFEPVEPRAPRFGAGAMGLCIASVLAGPIAIVLLGVTNVARGINSLFFACAIAPAMLAVYLIRQVRSRTRAEHRAQHDALTGLPNQTLFHDRVDVALAHARRARSSIAVMFLDLDRFKSINDSLGHAIGNQLLQGVAKRLRAALREIDTVARMGGDEFAVILHDVSNKETAALVAQKIVGQFEMPFVVTGRELYTSTSIGIAMFPEHGDDRDALLKHADSAMYRAKARGRDTYEFYTEELSTTARARLSVESALRQAIDRSALELHYQPQVDVSTGSIVGLEALARWPHDDVGLIMPNVFIPVAEETGLITALGTWVIDETCAQLRRWRKAGIEPRPVAVNVSARQLTGSFVEYVSNTLDRYDIPLGLLELEITESVFMRDLATSARILLELRDLGVYCSIDDFGTGFSGLSYLAELPIDTLKIDQSFVSRIVRPHDEAPIIEAIIAMADALHLNVVAEGVETEAQAWFLAAHGCKEMQGYLFSPPRTGDAMARLLALDDLHSLRWLHSAEGDIVPAAVEPVPPSSGSSLLASLCMGRLPDDRRVDAARLLEALEVKGSTRDTRTALRAMSMRLAGGLAEAGALPRHSMKARSTARCIAMSSMGAGLENKKP